MGRNIFVWVIQVVLPGKSIIYKHGQNILRFLIFDQILPSTQVKQSMIISNKHDVYEFSHELPNELRLRILGNYKISGKSQSVVEL